MFNLGEIEVNTLYPHLFIGLGGSGSRIVDRIAGNLSRLPEWDKKMRSLYHFLAIDTNDLDLVGLKNIPKEYRIGLYLEDRADLVERQRLDNDPRVMAWLDPEYKPREGQTPGAGQIRIESRVGFYFNSDDVAKALDTVIDQSLRSNPYRNDQGKRYSVYVFCSVAGGTGSGAFLSAAYLVAERIKLRNWNPQIVGNILLSTLFTDKVQPELHAGIHANSYAALKELEHLTKLSYGSQVIDFDYANVVSQTKGNVVRDRPFFMTNIFDKPNETSFVDYESAISDALLMMVVSPVGAHIYSAQDNYAKENSEPTRLLGPASAISSGFTKAYGTVGSAALSVPVKELLEYCAHRFAAQAIREFVTFSSSSDVEQIAQDYLVDYDDPKFLKMDDAAKADRINESFMQTARALASRDREEEDLNGYWLRLVESIDEGAALGEASTTEVRRGTSLQEQVNRRLEDACSDLVQSCVKINPYPFNFEKDGVGRYDEYINILKDECSQSFEAVEEKLDAKRSYFRRGDNFAELNVDALTERYLLIRISRQLSNEWLPGAEQKLRAAEGFWPLLESGNRRLLETKEKLTKAASRWGRSTFQLARDNASNAYTKVISFAEAYLRARVKIAFLEEIKVFVEERLQDYLWLSQTANRDAAQLNERARLLERASIAETNFSVCTEVFRTYLPEGRRLWNIYFDKYLAAGASRAILFDRTRISEAIRNSFESTPDADGRLHKPSAPETARRLRESFLEMGRRELSDQIFERLDLTRALEIEAEIESGLPKGQLSKEASDKYIYDKIRGFEMQVDLLGRVTRQARNDGVVKYEDLVILMPKGMASDNIISEFVRSQFRITNQKLLQWSDPYSIVGYHVLANVPLCYFSAIGGELHDAYKYVQQRPRRSYNLHTDKNWEYGLPDLNEKERQHNAEEAIRLLVESFMCGLIGHLDAISMDGVLKWWPGGTWGFELGKPPSNWVFEMEKRARDIKRNGYAGIIYEQIVAEAKKTSNGQRRKYIEDAMKHIQIRQRKIAKRRSEDVVRGEDRIDEPILDLLYLQLDHHLRDLIFDE